MIRCSLLQPRLYRTWGLGMESVSGSLLGVIEQSRVDDGLMVNEFVRFSTLKLAVQNQDLHTKT